MNLNQQIESAALILKQGGVGVFPTETVYGLGADALNPIACARLFEIKRRPHFNPLIVHVSDETGARAICAEIPAMALQLMQRFWPGPLTLVLPKGPNIPDLVTAGLPTVAIRAPQHPTAQALLHALGRPIAAPSANPFTGLSPTAVDHLNTELKASVDFILDGGPCAVGLESTIIGWINGEPTLLRPGGLAQEDIEPITGPLKKYESEQNILSPGMLKRHYAPKTPLQLWNGTPPTPQSPHCGILSITPRPPIDAYLARQVLSPSGDLREAASQLFSTLRILDNLGLDRIYAELAPECGLGVAINDRLRRGAHSV